MSPIMITAFYLPAFLAAMYVWAIVRLWKIDQTETKRFILALTCIFGIAHINAIWLDASTLMWYEVLIFFPMWFGLKSRHGRALSILTIMMILNNGYFEIVGGWPLHRLSVVSFLFLIQCVIGIRLSYHPHYNQEKNQGSHHGSILAQVQALLGIHKAS